jgi:hypothetical protein
LNKDPGDTKEDGNAKSCERIYGTGVIGPGPTGTAAVGGGVGAAVGAPDGVMPGVAVGTAGAETAGQLANTALNVGVGVVMVRADGAGVWVAFENVGQGGSPGPDE